MWKCYPIGKRIGVSPSNSPAATIFRFEPKSMSQSDNSDTAQKGLAKSRWSIWGGMQSPSSYMLTMQLSGTQVAGRTCHLTNLFIICLNNGGNGSTSASLTMPGGFPYLSWNVLKIESSVAIQIRSKRSKKKKKGEKPKKRLPMHSCSSNQIV